MDDILEQQNAIESQDVTAPLVEAAAPTMSLREQFAQYAYGKTIADVMTDPERDMSEIATAAARAGMDVIYGESHDIAVSTYTEISKVLDGLPYGHFQGVVLELPVEMQDALTPEALSNITPEDFFIQVGSAEIEGFKNDAQNMYANGVINEAQLTYINDIVQRSENYMSEIKDSPDFAEQIQNTPYVALLEMAQNAMDKGVPVYAADVDRERLISAILEEGGMIDMSHSDRIFHEGLDDRSDVDYLASLGLNVEEDGKPFIVHRGYAHINDAGSLYGYDNDGINEILEENGRNVATFAVIGPQGRVWLNGGPEIDVNPAQFRADISDLGDVILDRGDYSQQSQSFMPSLITDMLKP